MIHVLIRYTNVLNKLEPPHTVSFVTLTGEMYPGFQNLGSFGPLLRELGSEVLGDQLIFMNLSLIFMMALVT